MKYVKMLGLLAVAAAAMMAFAGVASATTVTSPAGTLYTSTLKASSTNTTLHNAVGTISCSSSVEGKVESHGAKVPASGKLSALSFTNCVGGSVHNATIKPGTLSVTASATNVGTASSSGATVMVTMFGVECGYTTEATPVGTVTGGEHAKLDISASLKRTEGAGGVFCGSTGNWTGDYTVSTPTVLHLDV